MNRLFATIRVGLLDMRGDWRRFALLIVCLAIGTALVAGVSLVGASLRQAIERDAALLMGGSLELTRSDRLATAEELSLINGYGEVAMVVDSNVRAETFEATAFVDLIAVGEGYPLLGRVDSPQLPEATKPRLLLADEPTGNLDQTTGLMVIELIFELARRQNTAVVLITHDPALAKRADRMVTMSKGVLSETPAAPAIQ